jgi:hypothetical protein
MVNLVGEEDFWISNLLKTSKNRLKWSKQLTNGALFNVRLEKKMGHVTIVNEG